MDWESKKPKFKIYQQAFYCDVCGEESYMGLIGFSDRIPKICDLCLINPEEPRSQEKHRPISPPNSPGSPPSQDSV